MRESKQRMVVALLAGPLSATTAFLLPLVVLVALGILVADGAGMAVVSAWYLGVPLAILCSLLAFSLELTLAVLVSLARSSLWRIRYAQAMAWSSCSALVACLLVLWATESLFVWPVALLAGLAGAIGGWVFVRVRDGAGSRGAELGPQLSERGGTP